MQKWRIRKAALEACASLIEVNISTGDGDLYAGVEDWEAHDVAKFSAECERIGWLLSRKADHITTGRKDGMSR